MASASAFTINVAVVSASYLGLWGTTIKDVSGSIPTLTTPAGYAFSIWAVIFAGETALVIWQALPRNAGNPAVKDGLQLYFAGACVLQAIWSILVAQGERRQAMWMLIHAVACLGKVNVNLARFRLRDATWVEHLLLHVPIGLHAGWAGANLVFNINLVAAQYAGTAAQVRAAFATVCVAGVAAGVFGFMLLDTAYVAAVVWALASIVADNNAYRDKLLGKDVAEGFTGAITTICIVLGAVQGLIVFHQRVLKPWLPRLLMRMCGAGGLPYPVPPRSCAVCGCAQEGG
ncbi:hypothetical protein JKP88DRAFT_275728 [Tribonema minus]|uniref:Uncharacterized protein n=1 Tax=Tribonema minus TaxID=303371 RepID=A0A835ZBV1_9STRA|nr:hypothetical protein JKP88DRAFT_275728 [Tribonema minus]